MALKSYRASTGGLRHRISVDFAEVTVSRPEKRLTTSLKKTGGRNSSGRLTIRHRGGGHKRQYRIIDFKGTDKLNVPAKVMSIEYDPNREPYIALIQYIDGERRYILAPAGLSVGDTVVTAEKADIRVGNRIQLANIPEGFDIHNIEMFPGRGGQMVRTAGMSAKIMSKEGSRIQVRLPSGEVRLFQPGCYATLGVVGNAEVGNVILGKAGRMRWLGRRPVVRGKVMNPVDHPHGGGEARNSIGMKYPKTRWGAHALGVKTRSNKSTNVFISASRHKAKKK